MQDWFGLWGRGREERDELDWRGAEGNRPHSLQKVCGSVRWMASDWYGIVPGSVAAVTRSASRRMATSMSLMTFTPERARRGCGNSILARQNFDGPHVWHNRKILVQDAQKGQTSHSPNPDGYFTLPARV